MFYLNDYQTKGELIQATSIIITTNDSKNDSIIEFRSNFDGCIAFFTVVYLTEGRPTQFVQKQIHLIQNSLVSTFKGRFQ